MSEIASQGGVLYFNELIQKCTFVEDKDPCARCRLRRLDCVKVYGKQRDAKTNLQLSTCEAPPSIPRSPSAPHYLQLSPSEQQDIQFLYTRPIAFTFGTRVVNFVKSMSGMYINDPSLRYALLASSAGEFSPAGNLTVHVLAFY